MDQITFYRDSLDKFKCEVNIQGASLTESRVRLVLNFDNGSSYLFKGKVDSSGVCEISVPKLRENDGDGGTATLEVIAENAFFEPWEGNFAVKSKKSVQVEGVQVSADNDKRVTVTNVGGASKSKKSKDDVIVESIMKSYNPKSKKTKAELDDYEPAKKVKDWARNIFEDIESKEALYCMMVLEERLNRMKKKNRKRR